MRWCTKNDKNQVSKYATKKDKKQRRCNTLKCNTQIAEHTSAIFCLLGKCQKLQKWRFGESAVQRGWVFAVAGMIRVSQLVHH